jgi:uncharacterized membrane protein SirB2
MFYTVLKHLHVTTAVITALLFLLRGGLDAAGRPGWRATPLRFVPHINDSVLLAAAIGLCLVTGWWPFVHGFNWLSVKVLLLVVYIVAGKVALDPYRAKNHRIAAFLAALLVLGSIFAHALIKPY